MAGRSFKPKWHRYSWIWIIVVPALAALRIAVRIEEANWVWYVSGVVFTFLMMLIFSRHYWPGPAAEITIDERGITIRNWFLKHTVPCDRVVKAHSELFGLTWFTIRRGKREQTYNVSLKGSEIGEFRAAIKEFCPNTKVTGLPESTILASERT